MSGPNVDLVLTLVVAWILSFFLIGIGHRFVDTVTDRATETHLAGGFLSGMYLGFDVDPDTMIIRELVDLTVLIGSSTLSSILSVVTVLSLFEILFGQLYIWDNRGRVGVLGSLLVMGSGYLLPRTRWIGIFLFLFGAIFYVYSEESGF